MQWLTQGDPGPKPVLDIAYLARLEQHLDQATVSELLADGLIELTDRLERVAALAEGDARDDLAGVAHDLVAVAGHLGLSALSIAAVELQRQIRRADKPDLEALATPLLRLKDPSLSALADHLDSLSVDGY